MESGEPTAFEKQVLRDVHSWRTRKPGLVGCAVAQANKGLRYVTDLAFGMPGVQWTLNNVIAGLLQVVNELAQDTVWRESIYAEYRKRGYAVRCVQDIRALDLNILDATLEGVGIKYRSVTAAQGVAAGMAGAAGVIPDVVGLVALNLRAVGEYATYCGYDITAEHERLFALQILHAEAQPVEDERTEGLIPVRAVTQSLAGSHTKKTVEQLAVSASVKGVARALGQRLTSMKFAQIVPVAGAIVGGGANALYTTQVCTAAWHLYRERRILEAYPLSTLQPYYHA